MKMCFQDFLELEHKYCFCELNGFIMLEEYKVKVIKHFTNKFGVKLIQAYTLSNVLFFM